MPLLSDIARRKKIAYFLEPIPKDAAILEVGSGSGWAGDYLRKNGWENYSGIDLVPPADVVGDVRDWRGLGMKEGAFDVIIAFEVLEHADILAACEDLLKPGGRLLVTTPLPHADGVMKALETVGLNQKRTSPHSNLLYLRDTGALRLASLRRVAFLSQWGVFVKE